MSGIRKRLLKLFRELVDEDADPDDIGREMLQAGMEIVRAFGGPEEVDPAVREARHAVDRSEIVLHELPADAPRQ